MLTERRANLSEQVRVDTCAAMHGIHHGIPCGMHGFSQGLFQGSDPIAPFPMLFKNVRLRQDRPM